MFRSTNDYTPVCSDAELNYSNLSSFRQKIIKFLHFVKYRTVNAEFAPGALI